MRVTATYEWNSDFQQDIFELRFGEAEEFPLKPRDDEKGVKFTYLNSEMIYEEVETDNYKEIDTWPDPQTVYFYTYDELWDDYIQRDED